MISDSDKLLDSFLPKEYKEYRDIDDFYQREGYLISKRQKEYTLDNGIIIKNRKQFIKTTHTCDVVLAYDTETYKGACKLLARNTGKESYILNPTFHECLTFLFYYANNPHVYRFFYNLDFDFTSILKLWNDIEKITDLKNGLEVRYKEFELHWIKGRMITIKHIHRRKSVVFTDIFNFFRAGLNKEASKYLNDVKVDDIDGNMLNTSLDYWNERESDIIKYCIQDCILTQKLGKLLIDTIEKCNLSLPKYLVSSASLSKQYFRLKCFIPNISNVPQKILQIAFDTYYGGRFEMFKRGSFDELYLYDINSQYPSFIRNLPNLRDGVWQKTKTIPAKECLGYFRVKVNIPAEYKIPTIPITHNGVNKWITGVIDKWITWYDVDLIREYIIEIYDGYVFLPTDFNYKPFEKEIDLLFSKKQEYKGISELEYNLTKLTMNALYGCFIERHKNVDKEGIETINAGVMFNSVYASQITAFGRWSVIKDVPKENYDNIIAIHTDSIITDIPFDEFLTLDLKLGNWNKEIEGKGLILNTGMYQIGNIVKTRGIPKKYIKDWYSFCKANQIYIKKKFTITHMRKLSEGLIRDKNLDNVNTMVKQDKSVNCNSDTKRDWLINFKSFKDVLTKNVDSLPYYSYDGLNQLHPNPLCVSYRYALDKMK